MREESPVHRQPGLDGETPIWFVTRYDDVVAVLTDNERFVVDATLAFDTRRAGGARNADRSRCPTTRVVENLLAKDGDDHRRLRRLVSKAFTPRMVEQLRPRIQEIADELIDRVAAPGRMELVDDFAFPLPITVIAELLGIPVEDQARFRDGRPRSSLPPSRPSCRNRLAPHAGVRRVPRRPLRRRRAEPADDLLSALYGPRTRATPQRERALQHGHPPIVAGHETTVSLITTPCTRSSHPEALAALRGPSLMPSAVEELLRFDSPVERTITRWVAADVELGGQRIGRGELVIAIIGSANRDEGISRSRIDLERADNKHIGFGRGTAFLPRRTARTPRDRDRAHVPPKAAPDLRLAIAEDDLYWRPIPIFRSLASLPVEWDVS